MDDEKIKELEIPQYDIEIWDAKTNKYVADISKILTDGLNIEWVLNDVESITFTVDLTQFELMCQKMGVEASEVMTPYVHDVRIRRNGSYIVGGQVVEQNFEISPDSPPTMQVKCTGYLNLLKDQYIDAKWGGYSYSEMAKKIITEVQSPDNLCINGTFDIDSTGWLPLNGTISRLSDGYQYAGTGYLCVRNGNRWDVAGTQIKCPAGTRIHISCRANGWGLGNLEFFERKYASDASGQSTYAGGRLIDLRWLEYHTDIVTTFDNPYIGFQGVVSNANDHGLRLDDVRITLNSETNLRDLHIPFGVDTATPYQAKNKTAKYELQNAKDALMKLTSMESDNFDFDFSADRTFNLYARKGEDKPSIEAVYPGNIDTMSITRSAVALANKVIALGSGIGNERLQVDVLNRESQIKYGTHETMATANNVSLRETLRNQAVGVLYDCKDPVNLPSVTVSDGSINPSNVKVGDSIMVKVEDDPYLKTINNLYRIAKFSLSVDLENCENVSLTLEPPVNRPKNKRRIRYIKDTIAGNSKNTGNYWIEIQAIQETNGVKRNVALGKNVACNGTIAAGTPSHLTNGNTNKAEYLGTWTNPASVVIDLGDVIEVDYIIVWHYYDDGMYFLSNKLSVGEFCTASQISNNEPLEHILINTDVTGSYIEQPQGHSTAWLMEDMDGSI